MPNMRSIKKPSWITHCGEGNQACLGLGGDEVCSGNREGAEKGKNTHKFHKGTSSRQADFRNFQAQKVRDDCGMDTELGRSSLGL